MPPIKFQASGKEVDRVTKKVSMVHHYIKNTPKDELIPKFLYFMISSEKYIQTIMSNSFGVTYPAINSSIIGTFPCIIPDLNEQKQITEFLDKQTSKIDKLISKAKLQIKTLQEYRQSLISSAVTGKICVTN